MTAPGVVVWITGKPSSGKSTLAERAHAALCERAVACCVLDGDAVRAALVPRPGYDPEARDAFYQTLANLAALLARQGLVVLVAATAHAARFRQRARELAPRFVEVFVDVSADELSRRDAKGLYRAVREGDASDVPGADLAYEPPLAPDVTAAGGRDEQALARVIERVIG